MTIPKDQFDNLDNLGEALVVLGNEIAAPESQTPSRSAASGHVSQGWRDMWATAMITALEANGFWLADERLRTRLYDALRTEEGRQITIDAAFRIAEAARVAENSGRAIELGAHNPTRWPEIIAAAPATQPTAADQIYMLRQRGIWPAHEALGDRLRGAILAGYEAFRPWTDAQVVEIAEAAETACEMEPRLGWLAGLVDELVSANPENWQAMVSAAAFDSNHETWVANVRAKAKGSEV